MPWCRPCERYLTPNTVDPDGSCPSCGQAVELGARVSSGPSTGAATSQVPWHFWVLLVLAVVYLGWRAVQGVALLF